MLDFIKKELVSLVKWMLVISFAAVAYYNVVPKYQVFGVERLRLNQVTGRVYLPPTISLESQVPEYDENAPGEFWDKFVTKKKEKQHGFWFIEEAPK